MKKVSFFSVFVISLALATSSTAFAQPNSKFIKPVVRGPQSDESVYFIMTDRFENGDTSNDYGGSNKSR